MSGDVSHALGEVRRCEHPLVQLAHIGLMDAVTCVTNRLAMASPLGRIAPFLRVRGVTFVHSAKGATPGRGGLRHALARRAPVGMERRASRDLVVPATFKKGRNAVPWVRQT